jgi:hypothetical protein
MSEIRQRFDQVCLSFAVFRGSRAPANALVPQGTKAECGKKHAATQVRTDKSRPAPMVMKVQSGLAAQ